MQDILKDQPHPDSHPKLFNFISPSASATFYDEFYSGQQRNEPELLGEIQKQHREQGTAYKIMEEIMALLEKKLPAGAVVVELGGGMYQHRSANAYKRFPNYYPLDIGYSNIRQYTEKFDREGIVADATKLPFRDNSVDCIITHTFLEHPLQPEMVVSEIVRVLKPGGLVVHNDAWFCRWWQRFGFVGLKRFGNMTAREKLITVLAKITEFPLFRLSPIIIKRIVTHLVNPKPKNAPLRYSKLQPNYNLHLGCDEDAASRIDPVDVMRFYESRGFSLLNPISFKERMLYPNKYIVLRKDS
jgi:ubiquinone/menaquinone biosynthesis C-methylase UbiE